MTTFREFEVLIKTVWGEARGEPRVGKIAVVHTVLNRCRADLRGDGKADWWGEGIEAVCLKPFQFSCWNANDPNRAKLDGLALETPSVGHCIEAALGVLAGSEPDPTAGATHYYREGSPEPRWAEGREPVRWIGKHLFFRDVE